MTELDSTAREILMPILDSRVENFIASQKYTHCDLNGFLQKFPNWDETKIIDIHDVFQVFEVDGDGLIEISEM